MTPQRPAADQLLTPGEVAAILFVDPKTVTRWARAGKLDSVRTPGGHRRYLKTDVLAIMSGVHHTQRAVPAQPFGRAAGDESASDPATGATRMQRSATAWLNEAEALPVDGHAAAVVVAEAVATALEVEALEAAQSVLLTAAAVAAAAEKAAVAAASARRARAYAASRAAETVARTAERTAELVQLRADAAASQIAEAATHAAEIVTMSTVAGHEAEAARTAALLAATVQAAADAAAQDTTIAAASVASVVEAVAAHVAVLVSAEDVAFENEVAAAADALHDVNVATADQGGCGNASQGRGRCGRGPGSRRRSTHPVAARQCRRARHTACLEIRSASARWRRLSPTPRHAETRRVGGTRRASARWWENR